MWTISHSSIPIVWREFCENWKPWKLLEFFSGFVCLIDQIIVNLGTNHEPFTWTISLRPTWGDIFCVEQRHLSIIQTTGVWSALKFKLTSHNWEGFSEIGSKIQVLGATNQTVDVGTLSVNMSFEPLTVKIVQSVFSSSSLNKKLHTNWGLHSTDSFQS